MPNEPIQKQTIKTSIRRNTYSSSLLWVLYFSPLPLRRLRRLRSQPLQNALVAEHKLAQALHHAEALQPEVLDRLLHEVDVVAPQPLRLGGVRAAADVAVSAQTGVRRRRTFDLHGRGVAGRARGVRPRALPLQQVEHGVDGAEGAGAAAAGGAVHEDGAREARVAGRRRRPAVRHPHHRVALLHQPQQVRGVRWCTEVGPARVLQLRDFAHWLERPVYVRECEPPHDYVRLL